MKVTIVAALVVIGAFITYRLAGKARVKKPACGGCSHENAANGDHKVLSCKLTTPESRLRKETVIKNLKRQVLAKRELSNGFQYHFAGSDEMVDELLEFVKTERSCCDFFTFNLSFTGDKKQARLQITGPEGVKEFIKTELEM